MTVQNKLKDVTKQGEKGGKMGGGNKYCLPVGVTWKAVQAMVVT